MKVEIEISDEDAKNLQEFIELDIKTFIESFIHQTCEAAREALAMQKSGVKLSPKEIREIGVQITKKAVEDSHKARARRNRHD